MLVDSEVPELVCPKCEITFGDTVAFAGHLTQNCQKAKQRRTAEKNAFALALNLIPKAVHVEVERQESDRLPVQWRRFRHSFSPKLSCRLELTSELGQMLQQPENTLSASAQRQNMRLVEMRCLPRESQRLQRRRLPFENVYRPIRYLKNSMIDYCLTHGDRRMSIARKRALRIRVKKECRKCSLLLTRLSLEEIKKWTDKKKPKSPKSPRNSKIHLKELVVSLQGLDPNEIRKAISSRRESSETGMAESVDRDSEQAKVSVDTVEEEPDRGRRECLNKDAIVLPTMSSLTPGVELRIPVERCTITLTGKISSPKCISQNTREKVRWRSIVFASTVFKCHVCGQEKLFQKAAWTLMELHFAVDHPNISPMYISRRQQFPSYQILIVEAFENKDG